MFISRYKYDNDISFSPSTIWPDIDPALTSSPHAHLKRTERILEQGNPDAQQSVAAHEQALDKLASQVQQLAAALNQSAA